MRTGPRYAKRWPAILLVVATMMIQGGCLSGPAPSDRFYRLEIPDPVARLEVPRLRGRLLVDSLRGDAMVLERLMIYRDASDPSQVKRQRYDHWTDPPPVMVQRAVVEFLRSANAVETVVTPEMRFDASFRLGGRIHRFERLLGQGSPRATIEVEFTLVRAGEREPLLLETYREQEEAVGSGIGESVEAFSRALHRVLERLVLDLPELQ